MNEIIKNDIIKQVKQLPEGKVKHLCNILGVEDVNDFDLLSERLERDVAIAGVNGISIKREVNIGSYLVENIDLLNVDEAHKIIDEYICLIDDKYSEEDDALVILYNYENYNEDDEDSEEEEEQEVIGVCDYIYRHIDSISSLEARQIIEECFAPHRDIIFDPNNEDIVIVE